MRTPQCSQIKEKTPSTEYLRKEKPPSFENNESLHIYTRTYISLKCNNIMPGLSVVKFFHIFFLSYFSML